jgi:RNase P/RNase MRP subunit p29
MSMELVGASLRIVESGANARTGSIISCWGTVIAESQNCVYVAYESHCLPTINKKINRKRKRGDSHIPSAVAEEGGSLLIVRRYIKEYYVFAVTTRENIASELKDLPVFICHGKRLLPHLQSSFISMMASNK